MSPLVRLAILAATAVVLLGSVTALLAALAYPVARVRLAGRSHDARGWWVLAWAALPWIGAAVILALSFLPSLWSAVGLAVDHCPLHDDGHVHLCIAHAPEYPVASEEWALLAAAALAIGAVAYRVLRAQAATSRSVSALLHVAGEEVHAGGLVASAEPLSITAGLVRPLVLVSTGLQRHLAPRLLDAVLAHERAHARRRDPLRLLAVALLGAAHLPGTRRLLLADAALACEQAADEDAAREVGDRTLVAEAIVAVERLLGDRTGRFGAALGLVGCATQVRVEALLGESIASSPVEGSRRLLWIAVPAAVPFAAFEIHHLIESILDLIAR